MRQTSSLGLTMVQVTKHFWSLRSKDGHVLQDNIVADSFEEALEYANRYASSFPGWTVDIVPLKKIGVK